MIPILVHCQKMVIFHSGGVGLCRHENRVSRCDFHGEPVHAPPTGYAKMRKCCNMKRVTGDLSWLIKLRIRKIGYVLVIKCSFQLFFFLIFWYWYRNNFLDIKVPGDQSILSIRQGLMRLYRTRLLFNISQNSHSRKYSKLLLNSEVS